MTFESESLLLKSIEDKAFAGEILIYSNIKKTVEEKLGKEVSDDYIWDLFKRHGWSKKVPRQHHPEGNAAAQEEYKKNFAKHWSPNH
jgi:transposase